MLEKKAISKLVVFRVCPVASCLKISYFTKTIFLI